MAPFAQNDLLPGSLGSVGGDQDVRAAKRIESPVGDVVEDTFDHDASQNSKMTIVREAKKKRKERGRGGKEGEEAGVWVGCVKKSRGGAKLKDGD